MHHFTLPFNQVSALSKRDISYQENHELFSSFYSFPPTVNGLKQAINQRRNFQTDRKLLTSVLLKQSESIELSDAQKQNIENLKKDNTFTVITAHQPSLLTGPSYFIIKILSTIRLAKELNASNNSDIIVPVFIIGGEDHDFEEINHLNIFGKKITWDLDKTGPVGRMDLDGLQSVISEFYDVLGTSDHAKEIEKIIDTCFSKSTNYGDFVFKFINTLFSDFGLIVANMDDRELKKAFIPIMQKELINSPSRDLVMQVQSELESIGFSSQAYPREINMFYLLPDHRERIVFEDNMFKVNNTDIVWSEAEISLELETYPERFSPNVIMRPLYQEFIWPNIAYVGGGGELAYWLERKSQFAHFGVFMPVLIRRNSLMIIAKSQIKQLEKLDIEPIELFKEEYEIINEFLQKQTTFDINIEDEIANFNTMFESISNKAVQADSNLGPFAEAEKTRMLKQLDNIQGRIKRSVKKREETSVSQIKNLKSKLFPDNGLQERHDNFFQFYLSSGPSIFETLMDHLNPLNKEFIVVCES